MANRGKFLSLPGPTVIHLHEIRNNLSKNQIQHLLSSGLSKSTLGKNGICGTSSKWPWEIFLTHGQAPPLLFLFLQSWVSLPLSLSLDSAALLVYMCVLFENGAFMCCFCPGAHKATQSHRLPLSARSFRNMPGFLIFFWWIFGLRCKRRLFLCCGFSAAPLAIVGQVGWCLCRQKGIIIGEFVDGEALVREIPRFNDRE